jgi:single-strand DNA-binding protein
VNVVTLIGNLATDVELREVNGGKKVASFLLAVDRPAATEADFIPVATWERQAEVCAQYLGKGKRVAVDGRLRSRTWETQQGERRSALEVVANRVEFLFPPDPTAEVVPFERAAAGS